ncbi:uncharacterized protein LOC115590759 isoform X2 [Sparus aurata]|uniref:uncharacterized protein LOC115590759 isoform X2 n=1 Tax=Sparus aurata TaxID=8175 RepID=UPI0011C1654C|nr:uncharacterized protein LOC115590759 isoform X2 [Sparus aurata]
MSHPLFLVCFHGYCLKLGHDNFSPRNTSSTSAFSFLLNMTKRTACFGAQRFQSWNRVGFDHLFFFLLLGTISVGALGGSDPWRGAASGSLEDQPLLQLSSTTVLPMRLQSPHNTNTTENTVRKRRSSSTDTDVLPPTFLTAADLPFLRDLVSDKKFTVRLGLHVSLTGWSEHLDPQLLLSKYKEPGIYNTGEKAGVFTMRVLGVTRVTSSP